MKKIASNNSKEPSKDEFFDGHRVAKTEASKAVVAHVLDLIQEQESNADQARKRARKLADQRRHEMQVEALVCDLLFVHLQTSGHGLCVSRNNRDYTRRNRYAPAFLSEKFVDVMDALTGLGVCKMRQGVHRLRSGDGRGSKTTLWPGPKLIAFLERHPLALADLGRNPDEEVIVLKAPKERFGDTGKWLDYSDNDDTARMRAEVRRINQWLEGADIELLPMTAGPRHAKVNDQERRLRRYFSNASFQEHGRLYGGFWQNLSKQDRGNCVYIDGEEVVALDYGQIGVRLMYAHAGVTPTFQDAYAVPGFENHREGVKKLMGAMLNSSKRLLRIPQGLKGLLPHKLTVDGKDLGGKIEALTQAVLDFHRPVAHLFYQGQGLHGMFKESEIMVKVLLSLIDQQITALPIHDGLLVGESHADKAKAAMLAAFEEVTGHTGVVKLD